MAFEINVKSQFRMIRAVLPGMLEKGEGSIINIASVAGAGHVVDGGGTA
ncbi:SDR family NAD(P)-dependent oxidoreductase [Thalassospira sp. CH_XMU1448-2]